MGNEASFNLDRLPYHHSVFEQKYETFYAQPLLKPAQKLHRFPPRHRGGSEPSGGARPVKSCQKRSFVCRLPSNGWKRWLRNCWKPLCSYSTAAYSSFDLRSPRHRWLPILINTTVKGSLNRKQKVSRYGEQPSRHDHFPPEVQPTSGSRDRLQSGCRCDGHISCPVRYIT